MSNNTIRISKNRVYGPRQRSTRHLTTKSFHSNNQQQQSFHEIKEHASNQYNRALHEILPALEQARHAAKEAREPAQEAERRWQSAHSCLAEVQGEAHAMLDEVKKNSCEVLDGPDSITRNILLHHAFFRMQEFQATLAPDLQLWRPFAPAVNPLSWLPGAFLLTQIAACRSQDTPFLIACISVAMPPLNDSLRSLLLHWSLADNPHAGWMAQIPRGWHTSPGISQPCGSTAWETACAVHAPIVSPHSHGPFFNGDHSTIQPLVSTPVYSVIVQIPMQDSLEHHGGVKFVLKRTDGGQPEWIKPHNHGDFFVDFSQAIQLFKAEKAAELLKLQREEEERLYQELLQQSLQHSMDADGLCEWGWARMLSGSEDGENDGHGAAVHGGRGADAKEEEEKQEETIDWTDASVLPGGWLSSVSSWQLLGDHPPPQPLSLSGKARDLRTILEATLVVADEPPQNGLCDVSHTKAVASSDAKDATQASRRERLESLLVRCSEVDGTLQRYDAASLAARRAQHEKERLWDICKSAEDQATHLHAEIMNALETARRTTVALRGRTTEVTVQDLERLAVQLAKDSTGGNGGMIWPFSAFGSGRQLAFVSQSVTPVGGVDATVLMQVYLEGDRAAVSAALAGTTAAASGSASAPPSPSGDAADGSPSTTATATHAAKPPKIRRPAFDTVLVSIAVAEPFPEMHQERHSLSSQVMLHFGTVPHQYGKWNAPPQNWRAFPAVPVPNGEVDDGGAESPPSRQESSSSKGLPWIPLQNYNIVDDTGSPVFVSPVMHGTVIRIPLQEAAGRVKGLEFVLKTKDDRWLNAASGANFFVDLPIYA